MSFTTFAVNVLAGIISGFVVELVLRWLGM